MKDSAQFLQTAEAHYKRGNLPQAEALCRHLVSMGEHLAEVYNLLGMVSMSIGLSNHAGIYFQRALKHQPSLKIAKKNLKLAKKSAKQHKTTCPGKLSRRFLLIKSWGCGFWADMDHVLGQLLLAEMTVRIPVVLWGANSRYHDVICENAFDLYFEPVSDYSLEDIVVENFSCFPPKWNKDNINLPEKDKWEGQYSRMAGMFSLARDEDVIVSDFHTYVNDLIPWLSKKSPLYGMETQQVYHYLFKKYLCLKQDVQKEIDQYAAKYFKDKKVLAIHVRGSDKITESTELYNINQQYEVHINKFLDNNSEIAIFLLTDSVGILEEYKRKYGNRLLYSDCFRTKNDIGIHFHEQDDRRQIGIDILKDTYLASMCDFFIGYGGTNVSTTVLHLKEWEKDNYILLGTNSLVQPHLFLHNR